MCTSVTLNTINPNSKSHFAGDLDIETHVSPINDNQADIHASENACLVTPSKVPQDINMKEGDNPVIILKHLREKNENRLLIAHLNINFLSNKFVALRSFVVGKIDILFLARK